LFFLRDGSVQEKASGNGAVKTFPEEAKHEGCFVSVVCQLVAVFTFLANKQTMALLIELREYGFSAETEKEVIIYYEGQEVGRHRRDIIVEKKSIVELKTAEDLSKAHYPQVRSYLKATHLPVAIVVNFASEKADFRRIQKP